MRTWWKSSCEAWCRDPQNGLDWWEVAMVVALLQGGLSHWECLKIVDWPLAMLASNWQNVPVESWKWGSKPSSWCLDKSTWGLRSEKSLRVCGWFLGSASGSEDLGWNYPEKANQSSGVMKWWWVRSLGLDIPRMNQYLTPLQHQKRGPPTLISLLHDSLAHKLFRLLLWFHIYLYIYI